MAKYTYALVNCVGFDLRQAVYSHVTSRQLALSLGIPMPVSFWDGKNNTVARIEYNVHGAAVVL